MCVKADGIFHLHYEILDLAYYGHSQLINTVLGKYFKLSN